MVYSVSFWVENCSPLSMVARSRCGAITLPWLTKTDVALAICIGVAVQ
ncbi:Uncharacterised protein [Vibrio cholerae]|nr:Uncharacterised protein [Vibrio cholerae]CSI86536.1 Uncharacterised protein [Vibrio cholerae]